MPRKKKATSAKKASTGPHVAGLLPTDYQSLYTHCAASWAAIKADTAHFATPIPATAQMDGDIQALGAALVAAEDGGDAAMATLKGAATRVRQDWELLVKYVQSVLRNLPPEAVPPILANILMYASNVGKHGPKQALAVKAGHNAGSVLLIALAVASAHLYTWEWSLDQASWTTAAQTAQTRTTITGLTLGKVYYFRVVVTLRNGTIMDPSQVVSFLVH